MRLIYEPFMACVHASQLSCICSLNTYSNTGYCEQQYSVKTRGPGKRYFACSRSTAREAASDVTYRVALCVRMYTIQPLQRSGACAQYTDTDCDPQLACRWAGKRVFPLCHYRHGGSRDNSVWEHARSMLHNSSTPAHRITLVL